MKKYVFVVAGSRLFAFPWQEVGGLNHADDLDEIALNDLYELSNQQAPSTNYYTINDFTRECYWKIDYGICLIDVPIEKIALAPNSLRRIDGVIQGALSCNADIHPRLAQYEIAWIVDMHLLRQRVIQADQFNFKHLTDDSTSPSSQIVF